MLKILHFKYWLGVITCLKTSDLVDQEKYDEAISMLKKFLTKNGYATEAIYYDLGRAYFGKKNYQLSEDNFTAALMCNKTHNIFKANILSYLGIIYFQLRKFKQASESLLQAIEIKKETKMARNSVVSIPDLYCYLGRVYKHQGEIDKAFVVFNEGLKYEANNEALQRELTLLGRG